MTGWYTDEDCTEGNEFTFDDAVTEDITIYPKWTEIHPEDNNNPPTGDGVLIWALTTALSGAAVVLTKKKQ